MINICTYVHMFMFLIEKEFDQRKTGRQMEQLLDIYKILSDETRLRMLVLLYQDNLCVCEMSGILGAPQPRISKNLSKLRDLSFVTMRRQEKFIFYSLKTDNKLLQKTIKHIIRDIEAYPQLVEDKKRLAEKDQYLSQCSV